MNTDGFQQQGRWRSHWQAGVALLAGWFVLCDSSSGVAAAVQWGIGLYGIWHFRALWKAWRNPVGICFALGILWTVASAGWGVDRTGILRDVAKSAGLAAAVTGLPLLVPDARRMWRLLTGGALLVTVRLGADLVRLSVFPGWPEILREARFVHPYLFTHPNVSCMMAGVCALALVARVVAAPPKGGWCRAGLWAAAGLDVVYLLVMASRGPQAVWAAGALALPFCMASRWRTRLVIGALGGVLAAGLWLSVGVWNPRWKDATVGDLHGRDRVWTYVAERVTERPLAGYGFGKKNFVRVVYEDPSREPLRGVVEYPHAHSYWLMLAFQGGAVAALLWGAGWGTLLWGLSRAARCGEGGGASAWRGRALPVTLAVLTGMILAYGVADYPDNVIRDVQFYMAALAMVCAWRFRGLAGAGKTVAA